ncbi:hypothetical protein Mth01_53530 [Sphaerimonospora thailandensis]|uniref:Uncharacterized protein n=1 Tax=Sphaerimonospora thailandensis TaxID=795644 RepID=A0A8J3W2B5_9ACTN|nr:hypothetical protein Mth01_53530 [Sphaerimonospora thailandensis]
MATDMLTILVIRGHSPIAPTLARTRQGIDAPQDTWVKSKSSFDHLNMAAESQRIISGKF